MILDTRLTGASSSPVRWGDLNRVRRGGDSHDRDSDTKDESGDDKLGDTFGGGSDDHSEDDDNTSAEHCLSSAVSIRQNGGEWSTNHGAADRTSQNGIRCPHGQEATYTVYIEKMSETVGPVVSDLKVFWKCGMAIKAVMREPCG